MSKLPSLITNDLTGEALNYSGGKNSIYSVQIKQQFKVTKNNNYTWTIKSSLYVRLNPNYPSSASGIGLMTWQRISSEYFDFKKRIELLPKTGIYIESNKVSNNAYAYYKVQENTKTINCTRSGRGAYLLDCGNLLSNGTRTYFTDYTLIYLTLPSFSGMRYKVNNEWKLSMPWVKVNGEWKRAKQYIKINGEWKEFKDTYQWIPSS